MHTNPAVYSTQAVGNRLRILVTSGAAGASTTQALVTLDADLARRVAGQLTAMAEGRDGALLAFARTHPGQLCQIRRACMATVLGSDSANPLGAVARDLADSLAQAPEPVRRAVADEVGRIWEGTEDIPVIVRLADGAGGTLFTALANGWLKVAEDADIIGVLVDENHDPLYEGLLAHLRWRDPDIDELCDSGWVDVFVDEPAMTAWTLRHRRHLADALAEASD